jgi:hypothetical protein
VTKHVKVLEEAGIVLRVVEGGRTGCGCGRRRWFRVGLAGAAPAAWEAKFNVIQEHLR